MISKTRLSRRSILAGASALALPSGLAAPASPLRGREPFARKGSRLASSEYEHLLVGPPGQGGRPIRFARRCAG